MLTNVTINAFKPAEKPYKKSDGGGLFLLVQPNGSKIWRFTYRFEGRQKLLSGGPFPQTSLATARAWRMKMKHQLGLGLDPSVERQKELEASEVEKGCSFEEVAREWLLTRAKAWVPKYAGHIIRRLEGDIFPAVGKFDIAEITPRQMLEGLRKIEAHGSIEMARRIKNHCSEIWGFVPEPCRCR